MKALVEGGEVVEALRERILGRVTATDVVHPESQQVVLAGRDRSSTRPAWSASSPSASTR